MKRAVHINNSDQLIINTSRALPESRQTAHFGLRYQLERYNETPPM